MKKGGQKFTTKENEMLNNAKMLVKYCALLDSSSLDDKIKSYYYTLVEDYYSSLSKTFYDVKGFIAVHIYKARDAYENCQYVILKKEEKMLIERQTVREEREERKQKFLKQPTK